ncbi:MAG TPA: HAD family phosphatase [Syntrophales bacterium]|nr:HAD family phosphatase [Syntrophales bacterium]HPQ43951.1 HAD family phosphatase [Syntrophales bacterium]
MLRTRSDISAVIFDMDGLMFDTERIAIEAWQRAGRTYHCEIPEALIIQSIGRDVHDTRMLYEQALGSTFDFDCARALRIRYTDDIIEQRGIPLKKGLLELLDLLENHVVLTAVATSTERSRAEVLLEKARLSVRFDAVVYGDEVPHGKPAPDIFLLAADRLRVKPQQCIVLEDSNSGILSAAKAKMRPFMIPDIEPPAQGIDTVADRIFPDLHAVTAYLEGILATR